MAKLPAIVPFDTDVPLPSIFGEISEADFDLAGGVLSGYAVISLRGKVWRAKYKGEEHMLRDKENEPRRRLQVVVVGVGPNVSKTYYAGAYVSGSTDAPDCASTDGVRPDMGVADPQAALCAVCPMNQFGSRVSDAGKKLKACQDNKRLAVIPADDLENAGFGGPMLLRVPPASFQSLNAVSEVLARNRVPFYGAILNISFDPDAEYPSLVFTAAGRINDAEMAKIIMAHREGSTTETILFGSGGPAIDLPALPALKPAPKAVASPATRKKAVPPPPPPPPEEVEETEGTEEGEDASGDAEEVEESEAAPPPPTARNTVGKKPAAAPKAVAPSTESLLGDLLAGL